MKRPFAYDPENPRCDDVLAFLCAFIRSQGRRLQITVADPTRTLEQNARLWAMLGDVAKQVLWPVDGQMQKLSPDDWKHVLSAGLKRHQRVAMGIDGGFVILGQRTSQMSKAELSDLIDIIGAFGANHSVNWTDSNKQPADKRRAA